MNRLLMLKVVNEQAKINHDKGIISNQNQQYEPIWGNYFQSNLIQDITLTPGTYIFLTFGANPI